MAVFRTPPADSSSPEGEEFSSPGGGASSGGSPSAGSDGGGNLPWPGWKSVLRGMNSILDDLVVALGSENVYVASREQPQPCAYPAYVARSKINGQVIALADKARSMLGREPQNIEVLPLLRHGVPESPQMFGEFLQRVVKRHFRSARMVRPRILCSGNFHNPLLKQVCTEGLIRIRSRDIMFCEPEIAAAVGMGLNILEPDLRSVLVFERDWTGFMVMSMSGSLTRLRLNIGFDNLVEDIRIYFEESNHVAPLEEELQSQFLQHGFTGAPALIGWEAWVDQVELGRPVKFETDGAQFQKAAVPTLLRMKHAINRSLQDLSREQRYTVQATPLHLAGDYASLPGLRDLLQRVLEREVRLAQNPAHAMPAGLVSLIPEIDLLRAINGGGDGSETGL